jgi:hypothetical protein
VACRRRHTIVHYLLPRHLHRLTGDAGVRYGHGDPLFLRFGIGGVFPPVAPTVSGDFRDRRAAVVSTTEVTLQAAYELVEILQSATDAELVEGASLVESVRGQLSLVGVGELVSQLREAEGVTEGLMQMGAALSPATFCILAGAHERAQLALRRAEALGPHA